MSEFTYLSFGDNYIFPDENYLQFFIRSFELFKEIRLYIKNIVRLTDQCTSAHYGNNQTSEFLKDFKNREAHIFIRGFAMVPFQYLCFHKSMYLDTPDVSVNDIFKSNHDQYSIIKSMILTRTHVYESVFNLALMPPTSVYIFQNAILQRNAFLTLPFMHTQKYQEVIFCDFDNTFGQGYGALVQICGDKKHVLILYSESILNFLKGHHEKLQTKYYFTDRGRVENFCNKPELVNGSTTITNNI